MCRVLGVSRSSYYRWNSSGPSARAVENERIMSKIRQIHEDSNKSYGSPRITHQLNQLGESVSRPRVARLMKSAHIRCIRKPKFVPTTDSSHGLSVSPNVLERAFEPGRINRAWCSDITYIPSTEGWLYLTVIMDLGDRRVIGWSVSEGLSTRETILAAWQMALSNRKPNPNTIFHSDRGVQYASEEFRGVLAQYTRTQSMSRKGNCWDNAVVESFFKSLKGEGLKIRQTANKQQRRREIFDYIEIWYNRKRLHSSLGYKSPETFFLETFKDKLVA